MKPKSSLLGSATALRKEADQSFKADAQRRLNDQIKILTADDLSGEYNESLKQLFTTERAGGGVRPITAEDLQAFRYRNNLIKKRHSARGRFKGGITAKMVIDLSAAIDRDRARKQITTVIPVSNKGSVVHFQTNASAKSVDNRHHVYVEFLDFAAWASSSEKPLFSANKILNSSPLKFDCDCGRHTFWYRYIASIGGFAYGRIEDGFPKVRNPMLYGVACKHTIKVMSVILQSGTFKNYMVKMVENTRKNLVPRQKGNTEKEQEAFLQDLKKEGSKVKSIVAGKLSPAVIKLNKQISERGMSVAVKKVHASKDQEKAIKKQVSDFKKNAKLNNPDYSSEMIDAIAKIREKELRKNL